MTNQENNMEDLKESDDSSVSNDDSISNATSDGVVIGLSKSDEESQERIEDSDEIKSEGMEC